MATFHVTPTGSDSNDGSNSYDASFASINAAIQACSVSYGDGWDQNTINVYSSASGDATYYGKHASYNSNTINTMQGNKYGSTIVAAGPHTVVLDCNGKTRGAYLSHYSTVRGFYFTSSQVSGQTTDSTVECPNTTDNSRIEDCTFDNCTDTDSVCVDPGGSGRTRYSNWVKRCTFKNLDCTSALVGPASDTSVFESILIYDCTFDFEAVKYLGHSSNFGILRHITVDNCTTGRHVISSGKADIHNCIVSNCAVNSSYRFYDVFNSAEVDNCLAYNNTTVSGNFFASGDTRSNCKLDDPVYVDRSGKDFTLQTTSPAKYTGLTPSIGSLGSGIGSVYDVTSGSFADPPSMGCYKFTAVATPVTVTFTMRGAALNFKGNNNSLTIKG